MKRTQAKQPSVRVQKEAPSIPFDDALRKILAAPRNHKVAAPKAKKKTGA
jgi:hypothetical protein